jgi:hypothetical protein
MTLYRVPQIVTLGRFPDARESDSTWRTKEVRHVGLRYHCAEILVRRICAVWRGRRKTAPRPVGFVSSTVPRTISPRWSRIRASSIWMTWPIGFSLLISCSLNLQEAVNPESAKDSVRYRRRSPGNVADDYAAIAMRAAFQLHGSRLARWGEGPATIADRMVQFPDGPFDTCANGPAALSRALSSGLTPTPGSRA